MSDVEKCVGIEKNKEKRLSGSKRAAEQRKERNCKRSRQNSKHG